MSTCKTHPYCNPWTFRLKPVGDGERRRQGPSFFKYSGLNGTGPGHRNRHLIKEQPLCNTAAETLILVIYGSTVTDYWPLVFLSSERSYLTTNRKTPLFDSPMNLENQLYQLAPARLDFCTHRSDDFFRDVKVRDSIKQAAGQRLG